MTLTRFDAFNGQTYTFPTTSGDQDFKTNFKALAIHSSRVPGVDGGVREYGTGRAPGPIGMIQVTVVLESATRSGMQALRDALNAMAAWGEGLLVDTLNSVERYAVCSIATIDMPEERQANSDLFQKVKLTFEVPEPYWLTAGNENLWNGAVNFNGAINWGGTGLTTITGSGSLSLTNNGSAETKGRFVALGTGATSFSRLIVRRTLNSAVLDEVIYDGLLIQNDVIEIDPRQQWVVVNGVEKLENLSFIHPDWLRLAPGSNTMTVTLDDPAAEISAVVRYLERYT